MGFFEPQKRRKCPASLLVRLCQKQWVLYGKQFFCLLFKSPLVTWFRVVLHYLRAVTHLQPAHTDAPLYKIGVHRRRTSSIRSLFHPNKLVQIGCGSEIRKNCFTLFAVKFLTASLNLVWIIHEERLLSHAPTCRSTMFYCTGGQLLPSNLLDGGAGMK